MPPGLRLNENNVERTAFCVLMGNTHPDLSKVGNRVDCNMSLTSQVCCYGTSDWSKFGSCDFHLFLKGDTT